MNPTVAASFLSGASGLALLAAHPPLGWWPLSFVHPTLLILALLISRQGNHLPRRQWRYDAAFGLVAGLTTFLPMLSWLIEPATVLGWSVLSVVQGVWYAVLAIVVGWVVTKPAAPLLIGVLWTGIEAWRGLVPLNGFEWGSIAYAHVDGSWLLPMARLVGSRGITLTVVVIGSALAAVIVTTARGLSRDGVAAMEQITHTARGSLGWLVGALLVSVLATIEPPTDDGDSLDILVVQGHDIRQWEETVPDRPLHVTTNQRDATLVAVEQGGQPDLTIWPESSIDLDPTTERGQRLAPVAAEAIEAAGEVIAGVTLDAEDDPRERYITAVRYDGALEEKERYVKRRLVPFGEYIPARPLLEWIPPLEAVPRDARPGGAPRQLTTSEGVPIAAVICFETLFTDISRQNVLAGDEPAQLLLSLTNDASFGESGEPAQHLAQVQMRAVETGRWVVHGALSGSSAFVSPEGEIHDPTPLFETATIRRQVPLVSGLTPYLVIGDIVGWATRLAVLVAAVVVTIGWRRDRQPTSVSVKARPASKVGR